jgi:hypothetical protein
MPIARTALMLVLLMLIAGAGAPAARAVQPLPPATIGPEDLYAALAPDQTRMLLGADRWPMQPYLAMSGFVDYGEPRPGELAFARQTYQRVRGPRATVVTEILVLASPAEARAEFDRSVTALAEDWTLLPGTRDDQAALALFDPESAVPYRRWIVAVAGPFIIDVRLGTPDGDVSLDRYTAIADAIAGRAVAVQDGALRAAPLPPALARLMLPSSPDDPGPIVGTVEVAGETFVTSSAPHDDEIPAYERLVRYGGRRIVLRLYGVWQQPELTVSVTVFPLSSANAATAWVREVVDDPELDAGRRPAGATGPIAAFYRFGPLYELQFAKGAVALSIACIGADDEPPPGCEAIVRRLAERWYAFLPEPAAATTSPSAGPGPSAGGGR